MDLHADDHFPVARGALDQLRFCSRSIHGEGKPVLLRARLPTPAVRGKPSPEAASTGGAAVRV
jgi:hypothetical protein